MMTSMAKASPTATRATRPVKLHVGGQTLALRSDENAEYVRALGSIVDARVAALKAEHGPRGAGALALLVCLQLADELEQLRARHHQLKAEVKDHAEAIALRLLELSELDASDAGSEVGTPASPGDPA
jgi:cell division protein ZapA (FtsZ GTPase activity inhibitor)